MADCTMTPAMRVAADSARSSTARDLAAPCATLKASMVRTRMTERMPKTRMKPMTSCTPCSSPGRARTGRLRRPGLDGQRGVDAGMQEPEGEGGADAGAGVGVDAGVAGGAHAVGGDLGAHVARVGGLVRARLGRQLRVAAEEGVGPRLRQRPRHVEAP